MSQQKLHTVDHHILQERDVQLEEYHHRQQRQLDRNTHASHDHGSNVHYNHLLSALERVHRDSGGIGMDHSNISRGKSHATVTVDDANGSGQRETNLSSLKGRRETSQVAAEQKSPFIDHGMRNLMQSTEKFSTRREAIVGKMQRIQKAVDALGAGRSGATCAGNASTTQWKAPHQAAEKRYAHKEEILQHLNSSNVDIEGDGLHVKDNRYLDSILSNVEAVASKPSPRLSEEEQHINGDGLESIGVKLLAEPPKSRPLRSCSTGSHHVTPSSRILHRRIPPDNANLTVQSTHRRESQQHVTERPSFQSDNVPTNTSAPSQTSLPDRRHRRSTINVAPRNRKTQGKEKKLSFRKRRRQQQQEERNRKMREAIKIDTRNPFLIIYRLLVLLFRKAKERLIPMVIQIIQKAIFINPYTRSQFREQTRSDGEVTPAQSSSMYHNHVLTPWQQQFWNRSRQHGQNRQGQQYYRLDYEQVT